MKSTGRIVEEWDGETCFIVAGGPSVLSQPIERLRNRRVIAINSAVRTAPFADVLFFGDVRWWRDDHKHRKKTTIGMTAVAESGFKGSIYYGNVAKVGHPVTCLIKQIPPTFTPDRRHVMYFRSSVTGALSIAAAAGAARAVLLGVDGRDMGGRHHNHNDHYPWPSGVDWVALQANEFEKSAPVFKLTGLEIFNASPDSAHGAWPRASLEDFL